MVYQVNKSLIHHKSKTKTQSKATRFRMAVTLESVKNQTIKSTIILSPIALTDWIPRSNKTTDQIQGTIKGPHYSMTPSDTFRKISDFFRQINHFLTFSTLYQKSSDF